MLTACVNASKYIELGGLGFTELRSREIKGMVVIASYNGLHQLTTCGHTQARVDGTSSHLCDGALFFTRSVLANYKGRALSLAGVWPGLAGLWQGGGDLRLGKPQTERIRSRDF